MRDRFFRGLITMVAMFPLLGACASIGVKRAGTSADFKASAMACKSQGALPYSACMARAGWHIGGEEMVQPALPLPTDGYLHPTIAHAAKKPALDEVPAASWWKMGGAMTDLAEARAACGAKNAREQQASVITCMARRGWHGAGG